MIQKGEKFLLDRRFVLSSCLARLGTFIPSRGNIRARIVLPVW